MKLQFKVKVIVKESVVTESDVSVKVPDSNGGLREITLDARPMIDFLINNVISA